MADTEKQQVGVGTTAQIILSMEAIGGETLATLDWTIEFQGDGGSHTIAKAEAIAQDDGSYLCLVDTSQTGKAEELTARLKVMDIPVNGDITRDEVSPLLNTNLQVV